jgi:hypothetical protein
MVISGVNTALVFLLKLIFILIITWILNFVCCAGYPGVAWLLFLLPYIIAIGLGLYLGLQEASKDKKPVSVVVPK